MTLKQFAEVGAGVVVAIILYNTNLISVVKWPLIVLAVGLGGAMAFMPIEERPLDHWIITFFRRLYSPTKFYWRRENSVPFALTPTKQTTQTNTPPIEVDLTPARRKRITEYLESVKQPPQKEEWEVQESSRVSQILQTFGSVSVENVDSKPAKPEKPQLSPRVRALASTEKSAPQTQVVFEKQELIQEPIQNLIQESTKDLIQEPDQGLSPLPLQERVETGVSPEITDIPEDERDGLATVGTTQPTTKTQEPPTPVIHLRPTEPVGAITVDGEFSKTPQNKPIQRTSLTEMVVAPQVLKVSERSAPVTTAPQPIPQVFLESSETSQERPSGQLPPAAVTNTELPFSEKQLAPNTIVGMVLTKDKKLIDRAVVKIKNINGRVIRALRTNLLGQFFATAPLPNGSYLVSAEKEGFTFPEQTVVLNGGIPAPLEINSA